MTHDILIKRIVPYVFIVLIHRLMRFPFSSSAWAAWRRAASH